MLAGKQSRESTSLSNCTRKLSKAPSTIINLLIDLFPIRSLPIEESVRSNQFIWKIGKVCLLYKEGTTQPEQAGQ